MAPADFEDQGTLWNLLGTVFLPAGESTLSVQLSTRGTTDYVIADAVWAAPA